VSSTNGAGLVRAEPEINAILVEDVATERQEANHVIILELQQANCTFEVVLLILAKVFNRGVREGGENLEKLWVEASRRGPKRCKANEGARNDRLGSPGVDHTREAILAHVHNAEHHKAHHEHAQQEGDQCRRGVVWRCGR